MRWTSCRARCIPPPDNETASAGEWAGGDAAPRKDGPIPVLVVDDQETFRAALRDLVAATNGLTLIGEAASGEAALEAVAELCPRLVIIDNRMPGMSGIEATRLLSARHPDVVVVLVSAEAFEDPAARSCGAAAFACKHDLSPRLLRELWRNHGS